MDFDYRAGNAVTNVWTGAYVGGVVTHTQTKFDTLTTAQLQPYTSNNVVNLDGVQAQWASGALLPTPANTTQSHTDYAFWDRPQQALIWSQTNTAAALTTTLTYNGDGRLQTAAIADGRARTIRNTSTRFL